MIDYIDLAAFCKQNKNKLTNIRVYGRITERIDEYRAIRQGTKVQANSIFCNMELVAINLSKYHNNIRQLGIDAPNDICFVRGSIGVLVPDTIKLNDWYMAEGTLRLSNLLHGLPVLAMFNFDKEQDTGGWVVLQTNIMDLGVEDFLLDNKLAGRVFRFIQQGDEQGMVILPDELNSMSLFYSDIPNSFNFTGQLANKFNQTADGSTVCQSAKQTVGQLAVHISQSKLKPFSPEEIKSFSHTDLNLNIESLTIISDYLDNTSTPRLKDFIARLYENYKQSGVSLGTKVNQYISNLVSLILKNKNRASGRTDIFTGKRLIRSYLQASGINLSQEYLGVTLGIFINDSLKEILTAMLKDSKFEASGVGAVCISTCFSNKELFYAGVLSQIVGISLNSVAQEVDNLGLSFSTVVNTNPYLLGILCRSATPFMIEHLALCMDLAESEEESLFGLTIQDYRAISNLLYYLRRESINNWIGVQEDSLPLLGARVTYDAYGGIRSNSYLSQTTICWINDYLATDARTNTFSRRRLGYSPNINWIEYSGGYCRALNAQEREEAISNAIRLGLVVRYELSANKQFVSIVDESFSTEQTSSEHTQVEHKGITFISDTLIFTSSQSYLSNLMNISTNFRKCYRDTDFTLGIMGYCQENIVHFSDAQFKALVRVNKGVSVIDGVAGSGKQDICSCIERILQNVEPDIPVKRLTFKKSERHKALFLDSINVDGYFDTALASYVKEASNLGIHESSSAVIGGQLPTRKEVTLLITGMELADRYILTNLFNQPSNLANVLGYSANIHRVIFVGDSKQISSKSRGSIFYDLIKIFPTAYLDKCTSVKNLDINLNNLSVANELIQDDNFTFIECADSALSELTYALCAYNTGNLTEDLSKILIESGQTALASGIQDKSRVSSRDIQIISATDSSDYSWNTDNINNIIENFFNTSNSDKFIWSKGQKVHGADPRFRVGTKYKIGDRVISTINNISVCRYEIFENGAFNLLSQHGILRNDIGTIVGILAADSCTFTDTRNISADKYLDNRDVKFRGKDKCFIVVRYKDAIDSTNFYVLYHAYLNPDSAYDCLEVYGGDISAIKMGYCQSALQSFGSKYKVLLYILGDSSGNTAFVNINALYSQLSQATDRCYIIGSRQQLSLIQDNKYSDSSLSLESMLLK